MSEFNQQAFIEILKKAIGTRQHKIFAAEIEVSPTHLSRMLNPSYKGQPSLATLEKIAEHAENAVTYQELLAAAGYQAVPAKEQLEAYSGTILAAVQRLQTPWFSDNTGNRPCQLAIHFLEAPIEHWYFQFVPGHERKVIEAKMPGLFYGLLFTEVSEKDKYSFVVSSDQAYEIFADKLPKNLNLTLSVIQIDTAALKVIREKEICRHTLAGTENLIQFA